MFERSLAVKGYIEEQLCDLLAASAWLHDRTCMLICN
jgi:hypothetical protein